MADLSTAPIRTAIVRITIGAFSLAALIGVMALLGGGAFGAIEGRILLTTLLVGVASMAVLCYLADGRSTRTSRSAWSAASCWSAPVVHRADDDLARLRHGADGARVQDLRGRRRSSPPRSPRSACCWLARRELAPAGGAAHPRRHHASSSRCSPACSRPWCSAGRRPGRRLPALPRRGGDPRRPRHRRRGPLTRFGGRRGPPRHGAGGHRAVPPATRSAGGRAGRADRPTAREPVSTRRSSATWPGPRSRPPTRHASRRPRA